MRRFLLFLAIFFLPASAFSAPDLRPNLVAPLLLEAQNLGDVWVFVPKDESISLETNSLLVALSKILVPIVVEDLRNSFRGSRRVSLDLLREKGIGVKFDEAALVLRLSVDEDLQSRKNLSVRRDQRDEREAIGPTPFSGYINGSVAQSFRYPQTQPRLPFQANITSASNFRGLVLETGATYFESEDFEWRREDSRLVKDLESSLLRLAVGDISTLTSGYQNSRAMGGLSVTRQFSIQPYLNIRPLNRTQLQIKRPSLIEVYVNGGFVNRLNAMPGPIELSDFPLFSGINNVDLKITDDLGKVEWVNLNLLYDAQLLGKGLQQFSYQLGAPSEDFRNDRRYDDRNITFSFFHRLGFSDHLTLGASLQADRNVTMAGQDGVLLTRGGLFSGDVGISKTSDKAISGAGRMRFRSLDYKLGADKPLRGAAEVEYRGANFAAIGQPRSVNEHSWRYDLSFSRPLTAVTSVGLGFQYMMNRLGKPDRRAGRLDFNSEIAPRWRATANYGIERDSQLSHRFQIVISWIQENGKFYGNSSFDYPSKTLRMEASRNSSALVNDLRATAGVQNSPLYAQADALFEYTHEKGNVRFDHASTKDHNPQGTNLYDHTTTLSATSAVAWAGGTVAWSRPISDSFALVSAKPLLDKFTIPVNRIADSAEAVVNWMGPGVVPTLTSYNESPIVLYSGDVPMGYSLGREYYLVRPTYRSGVKLEIGGGSSVIISGKLVRPGGAPLALATGEIHLAGTGPVSIFFTNREGNFLLENLGPGEYELRVDDHDYLPMKFTLTDSQAGFLRLDPHELKGPN